MIHALTHYLHYLLVTLLAVLLMTGVSAGVCQTSYTRNTKAVYAILLACIFFAGLACMLIATASMGCPYDGRTGKTCPHRFR